MTGLFIHLFSTLPLLKRKRKSKDVEGLFPKQPCLKGIDISQSKYLEGTGPNKGYAGINPD